MVCAPRNEDHKALGSLSLEEMLLETNKQKKVGHGNFVNSAG